MNFAVAYAGTFMGKLGSEVEDRIVNYIVDYAEEKFLQTTQFIYQNAGNFSMDMAKYEVGMLPNGPVVADFVNREVTYDTSAFNKKPSPDPSPNSTITYNNSNSYITNINSDPRIAAYLKQILERFNVVIGMEIEKEKQRWLEKLGDMQAFLSDSIAKQTMNEKEYTEFVFNNQVDAMQKLIDEAAKHNFPVDEIKTKLEKFKETTQKSLTQMVENAVRDFENNLKLLEAQAAGDPLAVAAAKRDIEYAALADQLDKLKNDKSRSSEEISRFEKAQNTIIDNKYKQAEDFDKQKKEAEQRANNAKDPSTAGIEAMRRLQERTVDYSAIMVQAFDKINSSMENHFTMMLTGAESFSDGFKNIFKDMTNSIIQMFIKMWYNQYVLKPLTKWFGNVLSGNKESSGEDDDYYDDYYYYDDYDNYYDNYYDDEDPFDAYYSDLVSTIGKARGGTVVGANQYLVGEAGPELFVPFASGSIVPNSRIVDAISSTSAAPAVTVNVVNNTGVQASARQEQARWDGRQYVVDIVLDAYARNVSGMRDLLGARG